MIHDGTTFNFELSNHDLYLDIAFRIAEAETIILPPESSVKVEGQAINPDTGFILEAGRIQPLTITLIPELNGFDVIDSPGWQREVIDGVSIFSYDRFFGFSCHWLDGVIVVVGTVDINSLKTLARIVRTN